MSPEASNPMSAEQRATLIKVELLCELSARGVSPDRFDSLPTGVGADDILETVYARLANQGVRDVDSLDIIAALVDDEDDGQAGNESGDREPRIEPPDHGNDSMAAPLWG